MSRPGDWGVVELSKDPTPGDEWGVKSVARGYQRIADSAEDAGSILTRVKSTGSSGIWIGEAGDAFRTKIEDLPDHLDKCVNSFTQAAEALTGWAAKMSAFQQVADVNLEKAHVAQADLSAARTRLAHAESAAADVMRTLESQQYTYDLYRNTEPPAWVQVPTAYELSRLRSQNSSASSGVSSEQNSVADAQARLDAARRLVWGAKEDYETAGKAVTSQIESAKDAGMPADSWWEKIKNSDWWQVVVTIATVVVIVAAVVAIIATGPIALIAAAITTVVGLALLADDIMAFASGEMPTGEFLIMLALSVIPGGRAGRAAAKAGKTGADAVASAGGNATRVSRNAADGAATVGKKSADEVIPPTRFRNDDRPPQDIFATGFQPKNPANNDLRDFVIRNTPSNFVSTTKDPTLYQRWSGDFRYQIQDSGKGIDVNDAVQFNPHWREAEIAFPGGIPREQIIGAQKIGSDGTSLGNFIENPFFGGAR